MQRGIRMLAGGLLGLVLAAPQAWAGGADGDWSERRSSHFVLLQDVDIDERGGFHGSVRFERSVLEILERAYDALDELLGMRPPRPIYVLVYDPAIFDASFAGFFRFPAAGFYQGVIRVRGETEVSLDLQRVLHHELVHAALADLVPRTIFPGWFNEGLAEWFEARALGKRRLSAAEWAALKEVARTGPLLSFFELSSPSFVGSAPEAARLAYLQSYAMIDHLARAQGERRLRDFVREVVRSGRLDAPFRKTYRYELQELPDRFLDDVRR